MKIILRYDKNVQENAGMYYDRSKKAKQKLSGAQEALEESKSKLDAAKKGLEEKKDIKIFKKKTKKEWYEKFRWFITSSGFLVIAGRDATTNEIIIKKHTGEEDIVFHTSMAGSPFAALKSNKKKVDKTSIEQAAQFVGCYSKAWRLGLSSMEVFYVNPDQVSKEAPSGEYITKGAFMIYGKKNILDVKLELYVGSGDDGRIMSGPKEAIDKFASKSVKIIQGQEKTSEAAKKIKKAIGGSLDDIVRVLPTGGCKIDG